jgi:kynurenine--oxoglutarate transaminase/cysteine-S-conjugate beta-lyase/glutamine--phenylpyruvate transaminase
MLLLLACFARRTSSLTRPCSARLQRSALLSSTATADEAASSTNFRLAARLQGLDKPTVWQEFSPLAVEHQAVNLGQGFPDWDPPLFVQQAMRNAIDPAQARHANQYARPNAHLPLATVLAEDYSSRWPQVDLNPATQVATAVGCTNVLYCTLQALVGVGDQVILLEPAFDIYASQVRMAGGTPVYVPLRPTGHVHEGASQAFSLDLNELEAAVTPNTKVLILNTPHNPTGKIFSRDELEGIAAIVQKHPQLTIISDEVYEHILFDPAHEPHISMATILFDQTLTLSSSGKTFSCTGWKVGWAVGPPHLVQAVVAVQQWVNFSAPTPNQDAIAQALVEARQPFQGYDSYYAYLADEYLRKRGILVEALEAAGMTPIVPPGGFFIMADTSSISDSFVPESYRKEVTAAMPTNPMPRDWALSRWLTKKVGVTAIPPSAFYSEENVPLAQNLLRFAFCKGDDTLREAQTRLATYFQR